MFLLQTRFESRKLPLVEQQTARAKMRQISSGKAAENERKYPYKVAIAIAGDGLQIGLSRRIMAFHQARHIKPRHGRTAIAREGEAYFRWCFSDLETAESFVEQFAPAQGDSSCLERGEPTLYAFA